MMPRLPSRAALLVPVLGLGLLVLGFDANLTRADTLPTPCELAVTAAPAEAEEDTVLLLSAILPADVDPVLAAPPRPGQGAPTPPGAPAQPASPMPPGGVGAPKPLGTDLRPPDPALLNLEPIVAARQLRESLSEKQKGDLRAVLTKHQDRLQQVRARLPEPPGGPSANRTVQADREATPGETSAEVAHISGQVDQEIELVLTPTQQELLRKARPTRLRSELPETPETGAAAGEPAC